MKGAMYHANKKAQKTAIQTSQNNFYPNQKKMNNNKCFSFTWWNLCNFNNVLFYWENKELDNIMLSYTYDGLSNCQHASTA